MKASATTEVRNRLIAAKADRDRYKDKLRWIEFRARWGFETHGEPLLGEIANVARAALNPEQQP